MTKQFRTSNPHDMHRDSAIDKHKASVRQQVEADWGLRPQGPNLNPSETSALAKFQVQAAEASLDRQHVQKQGGERAIAAKARAENLFSANIHRNTK